MATFRFKAPDGTIVHGDGANEAEALNNAKVMWTRITAAPGASQGKPRSREDQATYLKTLAQERVNNAQGPLSGSGRLPSFIGGVAGSLAAPMYTTQQVEQNELANAARRKAGQPEVSSSAIEDATRDASTQEVRRQTSNNPVTSAAGTTLGLLAGPEAMALEKGLGYGAEALGLGGRALLKAPVVGTGMAKTAQALKAASQAAPGVSKYIAGTAKSAAAGGGTGALLGFGEGDTLQERMQNAVEAAKGGALTGGVLHGVGAPAVGVAAPLLKDVGRGIADRVAPEWAAKRYAAADTEAARQRALAVLQQGDLTADTFADKTAPFAGMGQTLAEAGGPGAVNLTASLTRRQGTTGAKLKTQLAQRAEAAPNDILNDIHEHLGVDPKGAQGDIDELIRQSDARSGPLWQHAMDVGEGGVWSPDLHRLFSTSFGRTLLNKSQNAAEATGRIHEAPQYAEVEVPPPGEAANPETNDAIGAPAGIAPASVTARYKSPGRGLSLSQMVAKRGGMNGDGINSIPPDLAVSLPFHGKVAHPNGLMSDQGALNMATQEGYYPNGAPDLDQFLMDLRNDTVATRSPHLQTGTRLFAREAPPDDFFARMRQQMEEANARGANEPPPPTEEDYGTGPVPEWEPTTQLVPTGQTLDRVRRRANAMVKRDKFTGAPDPNFATENEVPLKWGQDFTQALAGRYGDEGVGAWPELRPALDKSSDKLGMVSAQGRVKGKLFGNTSLPDFQKVWNSLKPGGEQMAGRAQLANEALRLYGQGRLAGRSFATPDIQAKLQHAFPDQDVESFVQDMANRADLAKTGSQMAPGTGSQTGALQAAGAETDAGGLEPADVAHAVLQAGTGGVGHALFGLAKKGMAYPRSAGLSTTSRNSLGDILSMRTDTDRDAIQAFLRGDTAPPPPQPGLLQGLNLGPGWAAKALGVGSGAFNQYAQ